MRISMLGFAVLIVGSWAPASQAAEPTFKEDLAACKLPHGEVVIPDRNTPEAARGYILRFSDGTLNPLPKSAVPPASAKEVLELMRSGKAGDLLYSPLEGGCFIAVSGRASDLGSGFLYEMSGRPLAPPGPVVSTKQRSSSGEGTPGALEGVQDSHCYLVQAVDGKFALVRLVQKRERYALIQFVYQPSGEPVFEIPKGNVAPEPVTAAPRVEQPPPPTSVAGNVTDVPTLLEVRQKMIVALLALVAKPAQTPKDVMGKSDAIQALGALRAVEAVPVLVQQVDFKNPYSISRAITIEGSHPCVGALQEIGKRGSLASLAAIEQVKLTGLDAEQMKQAKLRLQLLVIVIKGVEGADVAEFMIKAKAEKAPAGASRAALDAALQELKQPG